MPTPTPARSPQDRERRAILAAAAAGAAPPLSPWVPPPGPDSQLQPTGVAWDAARAPAHLGDRAFARLDEAQGAVIRDPYRRHLYWLLPAGTTERTWTGFDGVDVFGPACWTEVPPAGRTGGLGPYWARPPAPGRLLTPPDALYDALTAADRSAASASRTGSPSASAPRETSAT